MYEAGSASPRRSDPAPPEMKYWTPRCSVLRW
jgi:hypothetical protein